MSGLVVKVYNNNVELALKKLKRKVKNSGMLLELKKRAYFQKPSKLKREKINFLIQPQIRFKGKAGEQCTFFILDPFGNALEFKAFQDDSQIYSVEL